MTRKSIFLLVLAAALGGVYIVLFTDLFSHQSIQVISTIRPSARLPRRARASEEPVTYPVSFAFDRKYELTSLQVVVAADYATNKYTTPVWHLISDSNSVPTKALIYGMPIRGMKPAVPKARPQPLEPSVKYLLLLDANGIKGETTFTPKAIE